MANNDINFYVIANTSSADSAIDKMYNRAQKVFSKPLKPDIDTKALNKSLQPLGKFSSNFKEFEKSLDAATARVVAFTATTGLIYGLGNAFKRLTSDAIQVEAAVARIQGILKASDEELASFTDSIFKLANNTGQGFYDAAKAAEEFARQGLSLEQTLKATESALILTRLSGTNLQDAMNGLVATVSSFSNELLDYGRVVNTLASIDAKFSTSAAGLVEGIKRVGSVASDAGVSFEELSSSIAAIRQITGRSESVIGNGLKTIFTNLQTEKVQQELAKLGIQTQKSTGEFLPLINVIDQLAAAFQNLNDSQRADLGQKVAGKYQINTFKALIQSFGGKDTSLFDQALQTAKGSQDEAIRRNELLNKTTLSTLNQLNNSIIALGASFGDKVGKPLVDTLAKAANRGLEVLTGVFKDNPIGDFITGGIVSALKGPGILLAGVALAKLTKRIVFELTDAVKSVGGLNSRTQQNLKLDEAINNALKNGNVERVKAINLATTLEEKQRQINALLRESYPSRGKSAQPYSPLTTLVDKDTRKQVLKSVGRNAANGIMPAVAKEQNSIYNGVGGARKTARPVIANINMAGGSTPVVVNTDEHIIRNFANTGKDAVFNRNMTRQAGGAQSLGRFGNVEKVMAAGYTPRVKGVTPSILEAPFTPTSGETFGLDPRKLDFIRKITENVTGARTKPVRFRKNLENYGEFWPDSNNVLVNPKVISDKSPYYGGYSVPAHEYGHFMEYNSDPALMDLFKSAHKFDIKKKGSLFNQMSGKIGSGAGYSKKNYFSESFADTFAYSFLDRGDREPALGGRAMSDLMRELIMNNIPVKSKANGFVPNFARRSRFQEKDDEFFDLLNGLDLDNIGYTPGTGKGLSDRTVRRGSNQDSFTRFTADRENRIIRIEDTESYQKGDAFKNYSAIADFAKRKDFIVKSAAFVKQGSRDNTKDKGISLLYKLFPQLRYRDGVTKNTSGKYHIGRHERKFSSFHDLKSQVGQLGDSHIRSISKFSDIQDNFAGGIIPTMYKGIKEFFAKPTKESQKQLIDLSLPKKSKRDLRKERKQKIFDYTTSSDEFSGMLYRDAYGKYDRSSIRNIRGYLRRGISNQGEFEEKGSLRRELASGLAFVRKAENFNIDNPTGGDLKFLNSFYDKYGHFNFGGQVDSELGYIKRNSFRLKKLNPKPNKSTAFYEEIYGDAMDKQDRINKIIDKMTPREGYDKYISLRDKLGNLNQIGSTMRNASYSGKNQDREAQLYKLSKKDKLSQFAVKKFIRERRKESDRVLKDNPMRLKDGRDLFKSLNKSLTDGSGASNTQFLNPDYLGIDKIGFLSRSIEDPEFLNDVRNRLNANLNDTINYIGSSSRNKNVTQFSYKRNEKARDFVKLLEAKIKQEKIGGTKSIGTSKLPPINLDILDDKLPAPPSSIFINNSGIPAPSGFHASEYAKMMGVTGIQDDSVVFKDDDSDILGSKTQKYIEKKVSRVESKPKPGKTLTKRLEDFKSSTFLERNRDKHIGKLIYESIKGKRKGKMAPQDPVGAQLALGNETIKEKLGFNPESLYGFAGDIDKAKYYFRGSSLDSFAIQNQLGEFTSSGFSNSDRVLGTNVSSSLLKAVGYAMSTGNREERPGLVGIYDGKKSREYSDSLPSPYSNEKNNTLKFGKLAEENLIAYFDPVSGRVLPKNNSLITGRKVDPYKVDYTKKLLEEGNILTKQYENSEQFKSDDSINLYRKVGLIRHNTTLKGIHAPQEIFDNTQEALPRSVDEFIGRLRGHTSTPQPGFISFGQESSSFFDLRSFRPISRDERKKMGKSKSLEGGSDYGKSLIYKKQVKSSDLVDMTALEALKGKTPEEIQEFFSKDRIYDLDSILGKGRTFENEREFTAFTTKPQFNIGKLIAKSAANGIIPNFVNPLKDSISREYDALSDMGYPSYVAKNSIKVGSHDRLKSDNNPNGLGVYNTAQGQMSLGQALGQHAGQSLSSGIIPNFADLKTSTEKVSSKNLGLLIISTKRLNNTFSSLGDYLSTSFLSSLRKTTGSIIDISDAANTKYKGIIDPTNIPSNKNAALVDPTGRVYGQTETARRLGLPVPGPIAEKGLSSNIVGLPGSFNTGKSVNYRELAKIPFDRTMIGRLKEIETRKKSDDDIEKSIQKSLTQTIPYGNIKTVQKGGSFGPNPSGIETVRKLGVPLPQAILEGRMGSPIAELPPILRNKVENTQTPPRETEEEMLKRLGVPVPAPIANANANRIGKGGPIQLPPSKPKRLSYQELANAQLPPIAIGLNLDVDAARKKEADLMKKNNEAIEEDIQARIKAQKVREDEASYEKQLAKEARQGDRKKKIEFIAEKKVSNLQYGGPQEELDSTIERLSKSKSLDSEFVSNLKEVFEKRQEKAFTKLSSQTGIFTSDKKLNSVAKKLNISTSSEKFLQRREEIKEKRQGAIQTGAFALPFVVGGIANTFGGQETSTGRITSGVGEAAGTALLLSQFGPLGIAAGVAVGSFQILSSVVKELTPDLNELSKKSKEVTAANEKEISSLQAFVQTSGQLKSLIDSNTSPSTIAQAKIALSESTRGLSGDSGMRLLKASTDEERTSIIQDVTLSNQRKQSLVDANLITGSIIKEKASGMYSNINRTRFNTREFLDTGNVQTIASELVKTIDLSKISNEAVSKAKTGKASLKDLGLDNAEVGKVFSDINKFFSNGSKSQTGASEEVLKFVQSLVVAQKSLDELSSQQIDTAKIFASTKESFLNILTSTFAQNESANRNLISGNEIGFSKAETILAKLSQSLSPEELFKGSVKIKQAKIDQDFASQRVSISNEYTNKILEDIMSQASGTSVEDQIKIQDILNKSITGESPFDPLKLTSDIKAVLGPDESKNLQSQLLKTTIEMAAKMEDSNNNLKRVQEEVANQTQIEQKQLSDTRLINLFGGFSSNFRDVLRSIKQPKGGLTTRGNFSGLNAGDVSNIGSAKPGTIDAVDKSQRNIEIAKNRSEIFSDIQLPEDIRKKINETNYNDLYLAGKSNIENRALAFGQQEVIPQFDILKSKIAGKDTGSFGRKAIDKQLEAVKKSFSIGQIANITPEFVKTIQSLIPTADKDGSIQKALDAILNNSQIVQGVFSSADSSAKALAEGAVKGGKLPPEFEAQITAIGNNTSILLKNTASLDKLEGVFRDLPFQIKDLREKSTKQIEGFNLSKQIETLQADTAFKSSTLQKATDAGAILRSVITQAERTKQDSIGTENISTLGITGMFPGLVDREDPRSLLFAGGDMSGKKMEDFLKFEGQTKIPSSPSELDDALKAYIEKTRPTFTKEERDMTFKKYSEDAAYKQLSSSVSKDSGLLYAGGERDIKTLNQDILNNTKKIEELKTTLENLNSSTKVQSNDTTQVAPTTTQITPTVNISFNGVGSVDPNKVRDAVYSALANINKENNLPPPIQRPVSNTLVA